jgi:hypothetical protein
MSDPGTPVVVYTRKSSEDEQHSLRKQRNNIAAYIEKSALTTIQIVTEGEKSDRRESVRNN